MKDKNILIEELYKHRVSLFIALCEALSANYFEHNMYIWRSKKHSDGSEDKGWFIMGINKNQGEQITYHLPNYRWKETKFAKTLKKAPKFDGHTSEDVLERLKHLL